MSDLIAEYAAHLAAEAAEGIDTALSPRTITDYVGILRRADRDLPNGLASANTPELRAWIFTPTRGPSTRLTYRSAIAGFFDWACSPPDDPDNPWLDYDPTARLPRVRRRRRRQHAPSTATVTDILRRAGQPYRLWFALAAYAGLRCVEISRMDRQHATADQLWVPSGKGDKERWVPTHPALWRMLADLPAGPVATRDGVRLTPQQVAHAGNHQLRMRLMVPVRMHGLRRWCATEAYLQTLDIRAVQEVLGHSSLATTELYVDVGRQQRKRAVAALPDLT